MTAHGEKVRVRGVEYVVVGVGPASTQGKFFGNRKFTLRKLGTNELFYTFGKRVAGNSSLKEVQS